MQKVEKKNDKEKKLLKNLEYYEKIIKKKNINKEENDAKLHFRVFSLQKKKIAW